MWSTRIQKILHKYKGPKWATSHSQYVAKRLFDVSRHFEIFEIISWWFFLLRLRSSRTKIACIKLCRYPPVSDLYKRVVTIRCKFIAVHNSKKNISRSRAWTNRRPIKCISLLSSLLHFCNLSIRFLNCRKIAQPFRYLGRSLLLIRETDAKLKQKLSRLIHWVEIGEDQRARESDTSTLIEMEARMTDEEIEIITLFVYFSLRSSHISHYCAFACPVSAHHIYATDKCEWSL